MDPIVEKHERPILDGTADYRPSDPSSRADTIPDAIDPMEPAT